MKFQGASQWFTALVHVEATTICRAVCMHGTEQATRKQAEGNDRVGLVEPGAFERFVSCLKFAAAYRSSVNPPSRSSPPPVRFDRSFPPCAGGQREVRSAGGHMVKQRRFIGNTNNKMINIREYL
ncbi:hypothetical protein ANTQUA_LOCUS4169 [Anthophora quadrimaculata]